MKKFLTLIFCLSIVFATSAQTTLSLNLVKGKEYKHKTDAVMKISQEFGGQVMEIEVALNGSMIFLVKNVNPTSYDMDVWYESMSMRMKMPQGNLSFSSENPTEGDIMSQVFAGMMKKPFQVQLSKGGKVNSVKNIESLYESAFAKFPSISEEQKAQIIAQVSQNFGSEAFSSSIESVTAIFPNKPVKVGETWNIKTKLSGAMKADVNTTYKYVSQDGGAVSIHGDSKVSTSPDSDYTVTNGMEMKFNLTGTMTSDIKIDKTSGWVLEAKTIQDIGGDSHVKGNDQMPDGITILMKIKSEMKSLGSN